MAKPVFSPFMKHGGGAGNPEFCPGEGPAFLALRDRAETGGLFDRDNRRLKDGSLHFRPCCGRAALTDHYASYNSGSCGRHGGLRSAISQRHVSACRIGDAVSLDAQFTCAIEL